MGRQLPGQIVTVFERIKIGADGLSVFGNTAHQIVDKRGRGRRRVTGSGCRNGSQRTLVVIAGSCLIVGIRDVRRRVSGFAGVVDIRYPI